MPGISLNKNPDRKFPLPKTTSKRTRALNFRKDEDVTIRNNQKDTGIYSAAGAFLSVKKSRKKSTFAEKAISLV